MQPPNLRKLLKNAPPDILLAALDDLDDETKAAIWFDWDAWARDKQRTPTGDWLVWLIMTGRGFGKTRTGAEQVRKWVGEGVRHIGLVGQTARAVRDVMIEGPAGILATSPPWDYPLYEPSKSRITWKNGAVASLRSSEKPDGIRGLNIEKSWCDEMASWYSPKECWDMLKMATRIGDNPQHIITTTPEPIDVIIELDARDRANNPNDNVVVTRGSTFENEQNLHSTFIETMRREYEGTKLGEQELYGRIVFIFDAQIYASFDHEAMVVETPPNREPDATFAALDWGSSVPTALLIFAIYGDQCYIVDEYYTTGTTSPTKYAAIQSKMEQWGADTVYVDSAAAQEIIDLRALGVDARKARKEVLTGIRYCQGLIEKNRLRICSSCVNLLAEMRKYRWRTDRAGNIVETPVKIDDHAMDTFRYGLYTYGDWLNVTSQPATGGGKANRLKRRY